MQSVCAEAASAETVYGETAWAEPVCVAFFPVWVIKARTGVLQTWVQIPALSLTMTWPRARHLTSSSLNL